MLDIPAQIGEEEEYVRATRRGGATGVFWSVVIGGVLAAWLHSSQIALPSDLAEVQEDRLLDPAPSAEAATVAYPAGHRLRRRGWVLRRVLLLADAAALRGRDRLDRRVVGQHQRRRPGRLGVRARRVLRLGALRPRLRPLPQRRAPGGAADRRRRARRDPARHADHVGGRARARRDGDRPARHGPDRALLGARNRVRAHDQGDRAGSDEPPLRRARADADRRRRPGRLARSRGNSAAAPNTVSK